MDSEVVPWSSVVTIPSTVVHAVAILVTLFRLLYRWHLDRFWWEDGWAALALICDMACLASVWMQKPPHGPIVPQINIDGNWLLSLSITSVVWFARMSILCSVVRIVNPTPKLRRIAYFIGTMFLAMEAGLVAQKIYICVVNLCRFTNPVAIAQLVTDIISDTVLVALPMWFLRGVKLPKDRRILILAAFSASMLITGVTILHSVLLLQDVTSATLIIGQIKGAVALSVCNSLVIATFIYRMRQKFGIDVEHAVAGPGGHTVEFTSVIDLPSKFSSHAYSVPSVAFTETRTPIMYQLPMGPATNPIPY